jgi:hypothetical protein
MRKEVVWAIAAGIILGIVVAYGVYRINSAVSENKKVVAQKSPNTLPTTTPEVKLESKIVIDKPNSNDVITEKSVEVSGITKPATWVIINSQPGDYITQSDSSGAFKATVDLSSGINTLKVSSVNDSGEQNLATVTIVYSATFQVKTATTEPSASDTTESAEVKQKVAQELQNAANHPKAYIGIVTDKTGSTIEIKSPNSEIEQISMDEKSTEVVNALGTTNKIVKTSDIAIGDFIAALGYVGANSVLNAQRILVVNPPTESKAKIVLAKVSSVTRKDLTVNTTLDNKEEILKPDTNTDIEMVAGGKVTLIKLSSIKPENNIIYVTDVDDKGTKIIKTIFVLSDSQNP